MSRTSNKSSEPVRTRLLKASLECFLADEYHNVSTRLIAEKSGTSAAMIRYYFGNKEGLYEEMIKEKLGTLIDALDGQILSSTQGFSNFLHLYYKTMIEQPEFPKLILKVLALNQGPGRRFIQQLLERGRSSGSKKIEELKKDGNINSEINPDIVRMAFVSLAITPMLLKDIFEEQIGHKMDDEFIGKLAAFNGHLFSAGLLPKNNDIE